MARKSFLSQYFEYLKESKKWWLAPIIIMMFALGILVLLGGTSVAPFIYTLF